LALLFLKLGAISFGGPAAHIALMEDEVVRKRQWITRQQYLDMLGLTNLIPGPNSTEMAISVGFVRAGWAGLAVAGASFIVPAALLTAAVAWAYARFGAMPVTASLLAGVKPEYSPSLPSRSGGWERFQFATRGWQCWERWHWPHFWHRQVHLGGMARSSLPD
jgi:hypothetical protein